MNIRVIRKTIALILAVSLSASIFPAIALASQQSDSQEAKSVKIESSAGKLVHYKGAYRFRQKDGSYATNAWVCIKGKTYYFDSKGISAKGLKRIDGQRYYFDSKFHMFTGWYQWKSNNKWSYFKKSGKMATGTCKIGGVTYKFGKSGKTSKYPLKSRKALVKAIKHTKSSKTVTTFGDASSSKSALKAVKKAVRNIRKTGNYVSFVMIDLTSASGISCNSSRRIYGASTVKGIYVSSLCKSNPSAASKNSSAMRSIIQYSDNKLYTNLRSRYGSTCFWRFCSSVGVGRLYGCNWHSFTAKELSSLWVGNYWYFFKNTNSKSKWCKNLYTKPNMSYICGTVPFTTYTKAGWGSFRRSGNIYNDAGIVMARNRPYVLAILSSGLSQEKKLKDLVCAIDNYHSEMTCK